MKTTFSTNVANFETETGDKLLYPFGPVLFQSEVDQNFTNKLLEEGSKLNKEKNDHNFRLVGQHKYGRSYSYSSEFENDCEPYLLKYVERYFNGLYQQYGPTCTIVEKDLRVHVGKKQVKQCKLKLDTMWINYSKKHDFNPPHTHTGILSFIIYCKVPDEIFTVQADSNSQRAGEVHFEYGEEMSPIMGSEFPIRPYENLLLIFPASLKHHVPSYWVDAERVSVSGNFIVI